MTLVATAPEAQAARKVACASVTYGEFLERGRTWWRKPHKPFTKKCCIDDFEIAVHDLLDLNSIGLD
jgi:hypothetical protein